MRRTTSILTAALVVGFGAIAHSQQQAEPAQLKPGFLGRILGLDSVPNPRLIMQQSQRQRAATSRLSVGAPKVSQVPRHLLQTRVPNGLPLGQRLTPRSSEQQPGRLRRVASSDGRMASSYTEPKKGKLPTVTPSSATVVTPVQKRSSKLSLANILRNRQSQPINEVTRKAPRMVNPFVPSSDEVYQPIASGPVRKAVEAIVEDLPEPELPTTPAIAQPLSIPRPEVAVAEPVLPVEPEEVEMAEPIIDPTPAVVEVAEPTPVIEPTAAPLVKVRESEREAMSVEEVAVAERTPVTETLKLQPVAKTASPVESTRATVSADDPRFALPVAAGKAQVQSVDETRKRVQKEIPESKWQRPRVVQTRQPEPRTRMYPILRSETSEPSVPAIPVAKVSVTRPVQQPTAAVAPNTAKSTKVVAAVAKPASVPTTASAKQPTPAPKNPVAARASVDSLMPVIRPKGYEAEPVVRPAPTASYRPVAKLRVREPATTVKSVPAQQPTQATVARSTTAKSQIQRTTNRVDATSDNAIRTAVRTKSVEATSNPFIRPVRGVRRNLQIAERSKRIGFKGFCPVELRDNRQLQDALPQFETVYERQTYQFSTAEALAKFVANPKRYAPAAYGSDVVLLTHTGTVVSGRLDFAAWHKGRLFLFTTQAALDAFNRKPSMYASRF